MNKQNELVTITSLGYKLDRQQRMLWKGIEERYHGVDPNHIPTIIVKRNDEVKQFFVLYSNGEPVW
ncbi:MAG: hypothetical protein SVY53_06725 [Chloroflexota bacterium]|nr:hypothetical protein [Chloroflexota bacterium]